MTVGAFVLSGSGPGDTDASLRSVRAQLPQPDDVRHTHGRDLAHAAGLALEHAAASGYAWTWLVEAGVQLQGAGALAALIEGARRSGAEVAASVVRRPDGGLSRYDLPIGDRLAGPEVITLGEAALLPVRSVTFASVLVRTTLAAGHAPPAVRYGDHQGDRAWTAGLMRESPGCLVTASEALRPWQSVSRLSAAADLRSRVRLMADSAALPAAERIRGLTWVRRDLGGGRPPLT